MKTEIKQITPSVAGEMLKRNINNRPIREVQVEFYSQQMINNEWLFDGQPIRFSSNGGLLDGQHRLSAVIKSGVPNEFMVITGIDPEAFKVMDTGSSRSPSDVLSIQGAKYSAMISSSIKFVSNFNKGRRSDAGTNKISNSQVLDFYLSHKDILEDYAKKSGALSAEFGRILSPSFLLSIKYLFAQKSVTHSEQFVNQLCTGLGLSQHNPIHVLRKKLLTNSSSQYKQTQMHKTAVTIKAWNLYRLNKECKILRWNKDEESFPVII